MTPGRPVPPPLAKPWPDLDTTASTAPSTTAGTAAQTPGPTLAAAFLRAGLVDEVVVYVAPVLLGAGTPAVADLGITTIADALRPTVTDVTVLAGLDGEQLNVRLTLTPARTET